MFAGDNTVAFAFDCGLTQQQQNAVNFKSGKWTTNNEFRGQREGERGTNMRLSSMGLLSQIQSNN